MHAALTTDEFAIYGYDGEDLGDKVADPDRDRR